jgi:peptidoglycan/LPS O-acetylase OafA/YrhL
LTFLWGFVFASDVRLLDVLERRRRELLMVGLVSMTLFYAAIVGPAGRLPDGWRFMVVTVVSAYAGAGWLQALVGYARAHVRRGSPALRYATEVVYPFYIVHQTVLIALAYVLVRSPLGLWAKLMALAAGTFLGSWAIVECVRRARPLRPLFGLKMRNDAAAAGGVTP